MKKILKMVTAALLLFVFLLSFTACSGGQSNLVGKWEYSHSIDSEDGSIGDYPLTFSYVYEHIDTITFYKDGTFSTTGLPEVSGYYEIINDGTSVSLTFDGDVEIFEFKKQFDNIYLAGGACTSIGVFVKK